MSGHSTESAPNAEYGNPSSWLVEGRRGAHWFVARDGDAACERYRERFQLPLGELEAMCVVAEKRDIRTQNDGSGAISEGRE